MQQHLRVFVTVVEMKNFSRAAEQLHMTQPAVSQYIKLLEQIFETKLLDRTNKHVHLTKTGEVVYYHAKEILGLYTKMHRLVDDLTNHAHGQLSIGASYTFGEYVLPHFIAKLNEQYPEISPSIVIGNTKDIVELVAGHQLDVGIIEGDYKNAQVMIEPFAEDTMYVVASRQHQFEDKSLVSRSALNNSRWIVRKVGSGTREATDILLSTLAIAPQSIMEFGSTQLIKESVESGLGITLLSSLAIRKKLRWIYYKFFKLKGRRINESFLLYLVLLSKQKRYKCLLSC